MELPYLWNGPIYGIVMNLAILAFILTSVAPCQMLAKYTVFDKKKPASNSYHILECPHSEMLSRLRIAA